MGFCGVVTPNKAAFALSNAELKGENTQLGGCFDNEFRFLSFFMNKI